MGRDLKSRKEGEGRERLREGEERGTERTGALIGVKIE